MLVNRGFRRWVAKLFVVGAWEVIVSGLRGVCVISPGGWKRQGGIEAHSRSIATYLANEVPDLYADILDSRGTGPVLLSPLFVAKTIAMLLWLRATGRVDVAHVQVSERGSFVRKAIIVWVAKSIGLRVILHHHGAEAIETYATAPGWLRGIIRAMVKAASVNVVLGAAWASWLRDDIGVADGRVRVLYNGIPEHDRPEPVATDGSFRPLMLAVLSERKGVGIFLDALASLKANDISFEATIAGGGDDLERFKEKAADLGIADRCTFPGWVDPSSVPALLNEHHAYILPSYKEGLPIGILEAMRAARPVITTNVGSIAEAIPDGNGVTIIAPGDAIALAEKLKRLAKDTAARAQDGEAARALYLKRFTFRQHIETLLALYHGRVLSPAGE